jgi:hypothetical protein
MEHGGSGFRMISILPLWEEEVHRMKNIRVPSLHHLCRPNSAPAEYIKPTGFAWCLSSTHTLFFMTSKNLHHTEWVRRLLVPREMSMAGNHVLPHLLKTLSDTMDVMCPLFYPRKRTYQEHECYFAFFGSKVP